VPGEVGQLSVPKTSSAGEEAAWASNGVHGRDEKATFSTFLKGWLQHDSAEITGNKVFHV